MTGLRGSRAVMRYPTQILISLGLTVFGVVVFVINRRQAKSTPDSVSGRRSWVTELAVAVSYFQRRRQRSAYVAKASIARPTTYPSAIHPQPGRARLRPEVHSTKSSGPLVAHR